MYRYSAAPTVRVTSATPSTRPEILSPAPPAHAFGRAGVDQVPRLQVVEERQVGNHFADVPDQLVDVGLLPGLAIDLSAILHPVEHHARHGHDLGAHRRVLHVLAQVPGAALVTGGQLQVAARHVQAAGIAVDQRVGVGLQARENPVCRWPAPVPSRSGSWLRPGRVGHGGARFGVSVLGALVK
jgi:hypothetical protein